jgi:hypothetical protein
MSSRYNYGANLPRQKRFIKRFKELLLVIAIAVLIVGVIIGIDVWSQHSGKPAQGPAVTTVVHPNVSEFVNNYFDFTAPTSWKKIQAASTDKKYVYQSLTSGLVEQELDIYVGGVPKDIAVTHVLPVRVQNDNEMLPGQVSDQCGNALPPGSSRNPVVVNYRSVQFYCKVDGTEYTVFLGERDGTSDIHLKRADGSIGVYGFFYRNSMFTPDPKQLLDIINSFHAR